MVLSSPWPEVRQEPCRFVRGLSDWSGYVAEQQGRIRGDCDLWACDTDFSEADQLMSYLRTVIERHIAGATDPQSFDGSGGD